LNFISEIGAFWCTMKLVLNLMCLQQKDPKQYKYEERTKIDIFVFKNTNNRMLIYRAPLHGESTKIMHLDLLVRSEYRGLLQGSYWILYCWHFLNRDDELNIELLRLR